MEGQPERIALVGLVLLNFQGKDPGTLEGQKAADSKHTLDNILSSMKRSICFFQISLPKRIFFISIF